MKQHQNFATQFSTKSILIGYYFLTIEQQFDLNSRSDEGYLERYPNHIIQLVGKSRLGRLGRVLVFFQLVEDTKISAK